MNILIPHSWLTEFLETDAKPKKIAECLSLCGPSVEKIEKSQDDWIYDIEVTTNRVDMMSVYGIAREAAAILPQFGYQAKLKKQKSPDIKAKNMLDIKITNNSKLCHRILAIKLSKVILEPSPFWLADRLKKVGQRPLNNAVDITNYAMWELGHPIHVFDYDRIIGKKIIVREAKKGETLTTLDGIKYTLSGREVIFDNGKGEIIDLPGIMGTANTVVTPNTRNVLLWIESVDHVRIRKASMGLSIRSQAAILNEKQVDKELGLPTILRAVELFKKVTDAKVASRLVDIYPSPHKPTIIKTAKVFIDKRLGVSLSKTQIRNILNGLEFTVSWNKNNLAVKVPSFRAHDVSIPEDIVEEIARIYGYYKLPSELMQGKLPETLPNSPFSFENKIKHILKGWGGVEVYTYSMVPKEFIQKNALKLKNPLGKDSEYLRTSLRSSLIEAASKNSGEKEPFHLFEMANVYLPRRVPSGTLPEEKMTLAGIFSNYNYREAKGIIEALFSELNISEKYLQEEAKGFLANQRVKITKNGRKVGQLGVLESGYIYYGFDIELLRAESSKISSFKPLPKYPPQIEDITLVLPSKTRVGEITRTIKSSNKFIKNVELTDIYQDAYTFRIWYQHPKKTLNDAEVEKIRIKLLNAVKKKFGATLKS